MKGFTLIEMVIVVGVIGILTSMVLVGLGRARDYAKDARITSNLNQLKVVAEMRYAVDGNYGNVSAGSPGTGCSYSGGNSDIMKLATDICNYGGILTITRQTTAPVNSKYCAYSVLNIKTAGGATQYFCVDSTGDAATLSEHSSCANSADPKCR
jgi:prepilin-type N-terminal cleavage/methylation domain-containing protein